MTSLLPPVPDSGLPVETVIGDLRRALGDHGTAVLTAEPGAGKTTIVPLRLIDEPWLDGGRIVVLEPRRVATRAAARRMAALTGTEVGGLVGYRTRDERRTSPSTRIEVVTEGVLTRRLQSDPELTGVGLVIFDEFHERNLQGDLGLALTLDARNAVCPDLRVLVMSATLDVKKVSAHLGGAPVVTSQGRQHPVDVRWVPRTKSDRLDVATTSAVLRAVREESGDVLVFLPGAGEIHRVAQGLQIEGVDPAVDVRLLYGALSAADQDAALAPAPPGRRKVVLSTDIAETSLTVEGVRVVVDSGVSRVPRFDAGTGMTRLTTITGSKASADQRAGRAGRVEPGVAYRLWSKVEHAARRPHLDPEITQVDLAGLALELASWGTTDARMLPFLDSPPARALDEARALLRQLGALDDAHHITPAGRKMVDLPLHPRLAHMVVGARHMGDGWLACLIAALLEDRDILRGRADELPADLALRLEILDGRGRHPSTDRRATSTVRTTASDIARRASIAEDIVLTDRAGAVLALAYPDRVAQNRHGSTPGRFKMRSGNGAWVRPTDALATEDFVVAAEVDGNRKDARIRIGAAVDAADVLTLFADQIVEHSAIVWDTERDDVVARVERSLGQVRLGTVDRPAPASPQTEKLLRQRLRREGIGMLDWTEAAHRLRTRLAFLHRHRPSEWSDVDDRTLVEAIDLTGVSSRRELATVDVEALLRSRIDPARYRDLDRLAPQTLTLTNGKRLAVDYDADPPAIASRVQDFFGQTTTPTVLDGEMKVVVMLLSPALRPVQVTSDLEGFWTGSWREVRKEMAGRYPKHDWPEHPSP